MSRSRRLKPVVKHVDDLEQQALREVARCQNALDREKQRLQQLQDYRFEYQVKRSDSNQVYSSIQLSEFQRFLHQLDQTIEQQHIVLRRCEADLQGKREQWKETRMNSKLMHKVVDKFHQEEARKQEQQEQKELDEFSLRKHTVSRYRS